MDAIFIKEKGLLATCGLDKKIKLWGIENLRPRGTLLGHKLGVRAISYAQSVLISGGFDNEAIVWDITSHEILCTMSGHQHAIGTVEIIAPSAESVCVVTLDDSGECRYWRLTNHGSRVECIDCFKLPFTDPSGPTRSVVMPWNRKHVVDDFPDLFFGGSRVYHMVPVKTMREFAPPSSSIYNSTSYQFVSAVGNTVHVWDSRTGRYLERFRVDKREISSMCFDMPRMRRVFLGTESGAIATLNYVTGEVLAVCAAHDREVSGLVFCELTKCVISYGADRRLHVLKDVKSSLSVLRTAENARKGATLTCLAYSAPLSLIATGDSEGGLVLWDFQTLQQHALIRLEGPAAACAVLDPYPLLATGDTDGVVRLWQLGLDAGYVTVDPLCVMGPPEDGTIGNPAAADRRPGSPARESNSTPSITGLAFLHKHRLHDGAAIEGSFKGDRARRATLRHLSADAAKSASTCVETDQRAGTSGPK
jgi:WD40 repeat protein